MIKIPYANNKSLPAHIKKLSPKLQNMWRKTFNSAWKQYNGDEAKAFKVANASIRNHRERQSDYGYQFIDDINKFMKGESREIERIDEGYGDDFHNQLEVFMG